MWEGETPTTASLLQQAMRQTAKRDFPAAEKLYQQLGELDPMNGLPAFARFLNLTGQTSKTQALLSNPALQSAPPVVRARVAIEGGLAQDAIRILREPTPAGQVYTQGVLLSNQLQGLKQPAVAAHELTAAIAATELTPNERIDLLKKLTRLGDCASLSTAIPLAAKSLVTSSTLDFQFLRPVIWEAIMSRSACADFASFQSQLLGGDQTPVDAWLDALASIRRGDARGAYTTLQAASKRVQSPRERAIVLEELAMLSSGDMHEALRLREEIITAAADSNRVHIDAASIAMRLGDYPKAMQHISAVKTAALADDQKQQLQYVQLAATAKLGGPDAVLDAFTSMTAGLKWQAMRDLAEAPFEKLEPTEVQGLRESLLKRLHTSDASPALYVLLLSAEHRLDSQEGMLAALAGYTRARPNDVAAQADLATVSAALAATMGQSGTTTSTVKGTADIAAQALWKLVEAKPYEPEPYGKLMELYRFFGDTDKATRVPQYLTSSTTAPAEAIALAAYIYATNGMPTQAVPLYERALKAEPNNAKFRLNYAGALTRVNRFDQAEAIFKDLIQHGVDGKQYHTHEVYAGAWELAAQRKALPAFIAFLDQLKTDPTVPQRDLFLLDAGKLLLNRDHPDLSLSYFDKLETEFPALASVAQEQKVEALSALKQFDAAEKQVVAMEKASTSTVDQLRARYNLGLVKSARGDVDAAVKTWLQIADENPRREEAGRSYLAAAQTLMNAGRTSDAKTILDKCIQTTNEVETEATARQLLEKIQKQETQKPAAL